MRNSCCNSYRKSCLCHISGSSCTFRVKSGQASTVLFLQTAVDLSSSSLKSNNIIFLMRAICFQEYAKGSLFWSTFMILYKWDPVPCMAQAIPSIAMFFYKLTDMPHEGQQPWIVGYPWTWYQLMFSCQLSHWAYHAGDLLCIPFLLLLPCETAADFMLSVWGYVECVWVFFCGIDWPRILVKWNDKEKGRTKHRHRRTWLTSDSKVNSHKEIWWVALIDKDREVSKCLFQQGDLTEEHLKLHC